MFCENYDKLVSNLEGRGFTVHSAAAARKQKSLYWISSATAPPSAAAAR